MKVVKLNRRFRQFKEHGHTVALKFDEGHDSDAVDIQRLIRARLGHNGWMRDHDWYSYYGDRNSRTMTRPYWITFRRESDLTMILLAMENNYNT
mgnify:CR=1 FL=1